MKAKQEQEVAEIVTDMPHEDIAEVLDIVLDHEAAKVAAKQAALEAMIDEYAAIYAAVAAKVNGEHMQAAIFAAIVSGK